MSQDLQIAQDGPILRITINRPQDGNRVTDDMARELTETLIHVADPVRLVLLSSNGPEFSNGWTGPSTPPPPGGLAAFQTDGCSLFPERSFSHSSLSSARRSARSAFVASSETMVSANASANPAACSWGRPMPWRRRARRSVSKAAAGMKPSSPGFLVRGEDAGGVVRDGAGDPWWQAPGRRGTLPCSRRSRPLSPCP